MSTEQNVGPNPLFARERAAIEAMDTLIEIVAHGVLCIGCDGQPIMKKDGTFLRKPASPPYFANLRRWLAEREKYCRAFAPDLVEMRMSRAALDLLQLAAEKTGASA